MQNAVEYYHPALIVTYFTNSLFLIIESSPILCLKQYQVQNQTRLLCSFYIKLWNSQPLWGAFCSAYFLLAGAESQHLPYLMYWMWYIFRCVPGLQTEHKSQAAMLLIFSQLSIQLIILHVVVLVCIFVCLEQGVCESVFWWLGFLSHAIAFFQLW